MNYTLKIKQLPADLSIMISEFADLSREREIKINALAASLLDNSNDPDSGSGIVVFSHNGERFICLSMARNSTGNEYDDLSKQWWEYDEMRCYVRRSGYRNAQASYIITSGEWKDFATMLLEMIDDERYCALCGHINPRYGKGANFVCKECALAEMQSPCIHCKSKMGRADDSNLPRLEHPTCKRRRT